MDPKGQRWEEALRLAVMADEYEAILALPQPQDRVDLRPRFEAARAFAEAALVRTRRRHLAALVCRNAGCPEGSEAPGAPFRGGVLGQSGPSGEPPREACYNTGNVAQEGRGTLEADAIGRTEEGRSEDRTHFEGCDRANRGGAFEAQRNREKAIKLLRLYFSCNDYEVTRAEADRVLSALLHLLEGKEIFDLSLRRRYEQWAHLFKE